MPRWNMASTQEILDDSADGQDGCPFMFNRLPGHHQWIILVQICDRWRQIALSTPQLWSVIYLDAPLFARECCMDRVKAVPLHLRLSQPLFRHRKSTLLTEIIGSLNCVETIEFHLTDSDDLILCKGGYTIPSVAHVLRSLRILVDSRNDGIQFLQRLKDCSFPAISTLELVDCVARIPDCLLAPTLTKLTLRVQRNTHQSVDFTAFVQLLSHMSRLEVLQLEGMQLSRNDDKLLANISTVTLPNLHQIVFSANYPSSELDYLALFNLLNIPSILKCTFTFLSHTVLENITSVFRVLLEHLHAFDLRTLLLQSLNHECTFGFGQGSLDIPNSENVLGLISEALCLQICLRHSVSKSTWDDFLGKLKLEGLQTLVLRDLTWGPCCHPDIGMVWEYMVPQCPDLKELSVMGDRAQELVKSLLNSQIVLSELQTISFSSVGRYDDGNVEQGRFMEDVLSLLTYRLTTNIPLQKVTLRECRNVDEWDVEELMSIGICVEWDRYQTEDMYIIQV
ncbi:hypothetical protein QCA50_003457 [Cerrena zonata]|uniref:F-box domain-containing protein n=1 Tax=Cerrena zonata TaxID=2478898 RepID=A0AAW0GPX5_9APHY